MKMMKTVAAAVLSAALALSAVALGGCAQSEEDAVVAALSAELESVKALDDEFVANVMGDVDEAGLAQFGIDATEFMSAYLDGFDYAIESVSVNGDAATALLKMKCKSFTAYQEALNGIAAEVVGDEAVASMSVDELNAHIGGLMMEALRGVEVVDCTPITVEYALVDGQWAVSEQSEQLIAAVLVGN